MMMLMLLLYLLFRSRELEHTAITVRRKLIGFAEQKFPSTHVTLSFKDSFSLNLGRVLVSKIDPVAWGPGQSYYG